MTVTAEPYNALNWTMRTASPMPMFVILSALLFVATLPESPDLIRMWLTSSSAHHGAIAIPIALSMILRTGVGPKRGEIVAHVILVSGLVLWVLGRAAGLMLPAQTGFAIGIIGVVGVAFGDSNLRRWALPLSFLLFIAPMNDVLTPVLQHATADFVILLLNKIGMPISVDGILIRTQTVTFAIAEACAGVQIFIAAFMLAGAVAYFRRLSGRDAVLYIVAALAIAFAANTFRAFFFIVIAAHTGLWTGGGPGHLVFGWVFYAFVLALVIAVSRLFKPKPMARPHTEQIPALMNAKSISSLVAPALFIAITGLYVHTIVEAKRTPVAPTQISPLNAPGWRMIGPPTNWSPSLSSADRTVKMRYRNGDATLDLAIAYFTHDRRHAEIVSHVLRPEDGAIWRYTGAQKEVLFVNGSSKQRTLQRLANARGETRLVLPVYWLGEQRYFSQRAVKTTQILNRLRGHNPAGGVMYFVVDETNGPDVLRAFLGDLESFAEWRRRNNLD